MISTRGSFEIDGWTTKVISRACAASYNGYQYGSFIPGVLPSAPGSGLTVAPTKPSFVQRSSSSTQLEVSSSEFCGSCAIPTKRSLQISHCEAITSFVVLVHDCTRRGR